MVLVGKASATRGGVQPGIILVIQGSDTSGPDAWIGVLGDFRNDDEDGGNHPYGVYMPDHG